MKAAKYPRSEVRKIGELTPMAENPRTITAESRARLKKSLKELGNISPVTFNVRTGKVLGGHKRLEVLAEAGEVETAVWCVDLSPEKERAAMLVLNTHAGEWDEARLADFLKGLSGELDAEFFGLAEALSEDVVIEKMEIRKPPRFAWVLIGVPIVKFGPVQKLLDGLPDDAVVKTTQNDGNEVEKNGQSQSAGQA